MIFTVTPSLWEKMLEKPLKKRMEPAPADIINFVAQYNTAIGSSARPCTTIAETDFMNDIRQAIEELPLLVKKMLEPRLLGIFFMTDLGSSAIMDVVARVNGDLIGAFVAIDLNVFLHRKANEWASWKENTTFIPASAFRLEAFIAEEKEDNRKSALQYSLLHEFGHVLAAGLEFMPDHWQDPSLTRETMSYSFLPLSWEVQADTTVAPLARDDFPFRQKIAYYSVPQILGSFAPVIYQDLEKTAFPTLYAATNVHEDFAECFTTYVHTVMLNKRHEINVYDNGKLVVSSGNFWMAARSHEKAAFFREFFDRPPSPFFSCQELKAPRERLTIINQAETDFIGLAPFLRMSIAGGDLKQVALDLVEKAKQNLENANLWMNLSTAMFSISLRDVGLSVQEQALLMQRIYHLSPTGRACRFKLLVLMVAGDISANTPLDCLLEGSDIDLVFYYATVDAPLPVNVPVHDALFMAIDDSESSRPILQALESLLNNWDKPVINAPRHIPNIERVTASELLQEIPGLLMPPTWQVTLDALEALTHSAVSERDLFDGCRFPIILRPVGSHAGRDLARIEDIQGLADYLSHVKDTDFYVSRFIDYSAAGDGLFRKYRLAMIAGQPFPCHMGISSDWMIHYVNAGMYDDAEKRAEEAAFMENFDDFVRRHAKALDAVYQRSKLDYFCIDCSETQEGELLIFEIGHAMVVHAMDPEDMFPYKQVHMKKVMHAFEDFLFSLNGSRPILTVVVS